MFKRHLKIKRSMKGNTHVRRVLADLEPALGKAEVRMLTRALRKDDAFAEITVYHDGWVPNSYRFATRGAKSTIRIEGCGFSLTHSAYDRKRSGGTGPVATCFVGKEGQTQGRWVWSV